MSLLWTICLAKYFIFIDFTFPNDLYRVVLSDFCALVFIFSLSKYTEDFPYVLAFVTAVAEYLFFTTYLVRFVNGVMCGMYNPLSVGLVAVSFILFAVGTALNFTRAVWVLALDAKLQEIVPGRSATLDSFWSAVVLVVFASICGCTYSRNQAAMHKLLAPRVYTPVSSDSSNQL